MPYYHYYSIKPIKKQFKEKTINLIKDIVKRYKNILCLEFLLKHKPFISLKEIQLNGVLEKGHEIFHVSSKYEGDFVNTENKEYDIVVCEILLILAYYEDYKISSDGFQISKNQVNKTNFEVKIIGNWEKALINVKENYNINFLKILNENENFYQFEIKKG